MEMKGSGRSVNKRRKLVGKDQQASNIRRSRRISNRLQGECKKEESGEPTAKEEESKEAALRKELEHCTREELIERIIKLAQVRDEFATLPDELVLSIFKYFPIETRCKTAQVSKRWRDMSYDSTFYSDFMLYNEVVKSGKLCSILARGCRNIVINYRTTLQRPVFTDASSIINYSLNTIYILSSILSQNDLHLLFSRCRQLTGVCTECDLKFNDAICCQIANNANLCELELEDDTADITIAGVLAIVRGCRRLVTFKIVNYIGHIDEVTTSDELCTLIKELPASMECTNLFNYKASFHDEHVRLLAETHPSLTDLGISGCRNLTGEAIKHVIQLKKLTRLDIQDSTGIPFSALSDLRELKFLETLWVNHITEEELKILEESVPNVEFYQ